MFLFSISSAREKFPSIPAGKLSSPSEKADALQRCVDRLQAQGVDLQGVTAHGKLHGLHGAQWNSGYEEDRGSNPLAAILKHRQLHSSTLL